MFTPLKIFDGCYRSNVFLCTLRLALEYKKKSERTVTPFPEMVTISSTPLSYSLLFQD